MIIKNGKEILPFLLVVILAGCILSIDITEPWIGYNDWGGSFFSIQGRNYLEYGYLSTQFAPVMNVGAATEREFSYYLNYPHLYVLLISFSFHTFGVHEWSARLVGIVFSLGNIIMLYLIARKLWGKKIAVISSLFLVLTPLFAFFGRVICFEPISLFFILFVLYQYLFWIEFHKKKYFAFMVVGLIFGCITYWGVYYLPPLLFLHYVLVVKGNQKKKMLILPLVCIIIFVLFMSYTFYLEGVPGFEELYDNFLFRTSISDENTVWDFTAYEFIREEISRIFDYITWVIVLLSAFWAYRLIAMNRNMRNHSDLHNCSFIILLFLLGLMHITVFSNSAWIHPYKIYYFLPAFVTSAALSIDFIQKKATVSLEKLLKVLTFLAVLTFLVVILLYFGNSYIYSIGEKIYDLKIHANNFEYHLDSGFSINAKYGFCIKGLVIFNSLLVGAIVLLLDRRNRKYQIFIRKTIIILLAFFLVLLQATIYIQHLHSFNGHDYHHKLGLLINNITEANDDVIISKEWPGPFVEYYAERDITWNVKTIDALDKTIARKSRNYRFYVLTDGDIINQTLKVHLFNRYPVERKGQTFFFNLKRGVLSNTTENRRQRR